MKKVVNNTQTLWRIFAKVADSLGEQFDKAHLVTIEPAKGTRSLAQNAYLWGVCYTTILASGKLELEGWRKEDLHEYFLGEHFGWETIEGFGRKRMRPLNRSSNLNKMDFVDYVAFIQQKMAEIGIVIPDPE